MSLKSMILATTALLLLFTAPPSATARESQTDSTTTTRTKNKYEPRRLRIAVSIGSNFNTGGRDNKEAFGWRDDAAFQFNEKIIVAINRHWGIFGDLGLNFFTLQSPDKERDMPLDLPSVFLKTFNVFYAIASNFSVSACAGATYLIENNRWQFAPRLGFGYMYAECPGDDYSYDGKEYYYKINRDPYFINAATSLGYRLNRLCSLILDVSYRCPVTDCKAEFRITDADGNVKAETYKSRSWANDLTVSLGVQFNIGRTIK